ncbi:response regulator [Nostoc sp. FACHB-152]|uniref:ATP-binding protein n=1 Tax=unclassified Nostoc TaxID=2593658 RepID=UPI0016829496|nr:MULTISPECIES: ATP-binding protein [unclassified Nostoc]MBD2448223.1 response regulator [Nostoc sp. FACHB-152]MBD2469244.1 response regulator [Nostoc sp. FACHB-145]
MCLPPNNTSAPIEEADVLITAALAIRPAKQPDLDAEHQAIYSIAQQLVDEPSSTLKILVRMTINLCQADSAGVSLLETAPNGELQFCWVAIAGTLEFLEQTTTPGNFSPCGTTLTSRQPQLYAYPERYFTYLHHPQFPLVEQLLIPLYVNEQPLGTFWIVTHQEGRQFDAEDSRLMSRLATLTAPTLQKVNHLRQKAQKTPHQNQANSATPHYSQAQFEALVANLPGVVYRYAPCTGTSHQFNFVSSGSRELLELEPETIIQDINSFLELIHPEDLQSFKSSVAYAVENFLPWRWEGRFMTPSGKLKWIGGSSRAVPTTEGDVWDGLLIDITNQKQAEAALHRSEEFNRQILDSSDDCIKVLDLSGRLLYMNSGGQTLVGIDDITPFLNLSWIESLAEADREAAINAIACAKAGKVATFQACRPTHTGEPKWWDNKITPMRGADGQVERLLCISRDITDRRLAELEREQLLASERNYANQLQGLTTAALAINSALSVEEVLQVITQQAASIIGAHQSVASMTIDQNWDQAIHSMYLSDKYAQWQDYDAKPNGSGVYACVCQLNQPMRMTQAQLESHPAWRNFSNEAENHPPLRGWLAAPLMGRDGNNIGLIQLSDKYEGEFTVADEGILMQLAHMASIAVENAHLYEAQQQARLAAEALREEAQAANRVKDEFLAVLSHELRSPLNPILGWATLLQTHTLDEARLAQGLAVIQRNAQLQSELIEDLLDVSRILRGKIRLNVENVDLSAIVRAAMETVRLAAQAKSIQVQAFLKPNVGQVSGDATRLQQVIWNLLSNAIKFTPERGQVNIKLEQVGSHAKITITDTGKGIRPDFLPFVFDYFRQEDSATTRKFGGLGLGLAIARYLVELHGGRIEVESPGIGQGATFTIKLPLISTQPATNQDSTVLDSSLDLRNIKVLVVDDETDTREFTALLLEQYGATVIAVSSAAEALVALTQSRPDVLLSDIAMPDVDGYMLIQQVRTLLPQGQQIPAIALTAYAGEMNQQQALKAGFQKHISKPIEAKKLVQAISSVLRPDFKIS